MRTPSASTRILGTLALAVVVGAPGAASATAVTGNVGFEGPVVFVAPIPGIDFTDLTVSSGPGIESTTGGEKCDILTDGSAPVDGLGQYPGSGSLTVEIEISRGGNNAPTGSCLIQLRASGNDGGGISASGAVIVEVSAAQIAGSATVAADDLLVRQSKTQAGLDRDCLRWLKKQVKLRNVCNFQLWKHGGAVGEPKCKDAGIEPAGCDPADYVEQLLAFSFDEMDQQTNPPSALAIDAVGLADQSKCQRFLGKAAMNFVTKRSLLVQKRCIDKLLDGDSCRSDATTDAKARLLLIDKCVGDQATDATSGLTLPGVGAPCGSQCVAGGILDRKCMKDCFELELSTLSDGLVGDVPECGNGVVQGAEVCDDGGLVNGDCCSDSCTAEPPGSQTCGVGACAVTVARCSAGAPVDCTPGTPGDEAANCADGIDNDCDGSIDGLDLDCVG